MARIDDLTREFMNKVAGTQEKEPEAPETLSLKPMRVLKQVVQGSQNPHQAFGKLLIRAATREVLDKEGSLNVFSLYRFLNDHYSRQWWDWEPETIWAELQRDHFSEGTPEEIKDMTMALQVTLNSHSPFEHWHVFENIAHAFSSNPVSFAVLQPSEPDEIALAMQVLSRIRPEEKFDREVLMYIAVCAKSAGMVWLPQDLFPGVQTYLDEITFEHEFRDKISQLWEKKAAGETDAEQIQIARLKEVHEYVAKGLRNA